LVDEAVLLADPHLVLEPDLNRRFRGEFGHDRRDLRGKVYGMARPSLPAR
jgi:hypothetical protein